MSTLEQKLADRSALIGVIGLGVVGVPWARAFVDAGLNVLGFDIDAGKIKALARGETYLRHLGDSFVREMTAAGHFSATSDFARLREPDAILICVPTPLDKGNNPD